MTITLILGDKPGIRKCNWYRQLFVLNPDAPSWHLLNSTARAPIDIALFSSDRACCPKPAVLYDPPAPPAPPAPPLPPCTACGTIVLEYSKNGGNVPDAQDACDNLATLMTSNPVLTGLADPGELTFRCTTVPHTTAANAISFQVGLGE